MRKIVDKSIKTILPILFGGVILYWMYRNFDFQSMLHIIKNDMNWTWMLLSFPFGILAQAFRGIRWKQLLEPLNEKARTSVSLNAVFLSYAVSLIVPRIGEFARCGVLRRYDKVSFPKALGTVVMERIVDTIIIIAITFIVMLTQMPTFITFFNKTGTSISTIVGKFSITGWVVTAICFVSVIILLYVIIKKLSITNRIKTTILDMWMGIKSLKNVKNVPKFITYSLLIWACYFLHYYLTFFCFHFTENLGVWCALVTFIVGSVAVIVPTPNGAGSWHFAVKTMLILYGVYEGQALVFVLVVHTIQTLLVAFLGIYAWIALTLTHKKNNY